MTNAEDPAIDDEIIATLSDYLDGTLTEERKADVERRLVSDPTWRSAHTELRETRDALSGLQKARAPESFAQDVTATIHKRSAGRFFAKRTFGDRIPLGVLLIIGLVTLAIIGFMLRSSPTGSLKPDPAKPPPAIPEGVVPKP
ncbi:MAG: hypothetical protein H0X17_05265 [Deltaproteobacteria bacterium]|nr:hypothetical protein [Deltaproteobacteria bacterium]